MNKLIVTLLLIFTAQAHAGHDQGGGGDAIVCKYRTTNNQSSYQVLDTFLAKDINGKKLNSLSQIIKKLKTNVPSLGYDLENFVNSSPYPINPYMNSTPRWHAKKRVREINDEELASILERLKKTPRFILIRKKIPANCKLKQVVVRYATPMGISYDYNASILNALSKDEIQLSYILIHEWLRNYFSSAQKIRIANWVFHSEKFLSFTPYEMYTVLYNLDFDYKNIKVIGE